MGVEDQTRVHQAIVRSFLKTDIDFQDEQQDNRPGFIKTIRFDQSYFELVESTIGRILERKEDPRLNADYRELMWHIRHSDIRNYFFQAVIGISKELVLGVDEPPIVYPDYRKSRFALRSPLGDPFLTWEYPFILVHTTSLKVHLAPLSKSVHEEFGLNNPEYYFDDSSSIENVITLVSEIPTLVSREKEMEKLYQQFQSLRV